MEFHYRTSLSYIQIFSIAWEFKAGLRRLTQERYILGPRLRRISYQRKCGPVSAG